MACETKSLQLIMDSSSPPTLLAASLFEMMALVQPNSSLPQDPPDPPDPPSTASTHAPSTARLFPSPRFDVACFGQGFCPGTELKVSQSPTSISDPATVKPPPSLISSLPASIETCLAASEESITTLLFWHYNHMGLAHFIYYGEPLYFSGPYPIISWPIVDDYSDCSYAKNLSTFTGLGLCNQVSCSLLSLVRSKFSRFSNPVISSLWERARSPFILFLRVRLLSESKPSNFPTVSHSCISSVSRPKDATGFGVTKHGGMGNLSKSLLYVTKSMFVGLAVIFIPTHREIVFDSLSYNYVVSCVLIVNAFIYDAMFGCNPKFYDQ